MKYLVWYLTLVSLFIRNWQVEADPVFNPANGHYYEAVFSDGNWLDVKIAAEAMFFMGVAGHLATITSQNENIFIGTTFLNTPYWLGGFQNVNNPDYSEPAGGWEWITGEPFIYTNWGASEPNDSPSNEDGIEFGESWNDLKRIHPRNFIVEFDSLSIDITAVPNPATVGSPLAILLGVSNLGDGFDAEFRLYVLVNGNVTTLLSLSPFVDADLMLVDFPVFSTANIPAGLPPIVGFLAAIFEVSSGELLDFDIEVVGIGAALSRADTNALSLAAANFVNRGGINAAPVRPEKLNFNGKVNNPFESQVNLKGKLTTTWGRIKYE